VFCYEALAIVVKYLNDVKGLVHDNEIQALYEEKVFLEEKRLAFYAVHWQ
jgi:hypothetical protein